MVCGAIPLCLGFPLSRRSLLSRTMRVVTTRPPHTSYPLTPSDAPPPPPPPPPAPPSSGAYYMNLLWNWYLTPGLYNPARLLDDPLIFEAANTLVRGRAPRLVRVCLPACLPCSRAPFSTGHRSVRHPPHASIHPCPSFAASPRAAPGGCVDPGAAPQRLQPLPLRRAGQQGAGAKRGVHG